MSGEKPRAYVVTDYHAGDGDRPYRNMLRDPVTDVIRSSVNALAEAIHDAGAHDGDEIEITVRRTGRRPFGDRKVRLVEPHTYARDPETRVKCETCGGSGVDTVFNRWDQRCGPCGGTGKVEPRVTP